MTHPDHQLPPFAPGVIKNWDQYDIDAILKPVDIGVALHGGEFLHDVYPRGPNVHWFVMGFRVFNGPREVVIEKVRLSRNPPYEDSLYRAPFDAAAFNLEGPSLPLQKDGKPYAGEPMRFVKQELGCIIRDAPMQLVLRPWQEGGGSVRFDALLIVREEIPQYYPGTGPLPGAPPIQF